MIIKYPIKKNRGFALVIALFLSSLILVMILAMSSMLRISTEQSETSADKKVAELNAIYGLKLALGNLQKFTGEDQRITAKASIIENNTQETHWVGVWDSDPSSETYGNQLTWLASEFIDNEDQNEEILLLGPESVGLSEDDWVTMKPTDLKNEEDLVGRYAYWIDDESLKHRVNYVSDEYLNTETKAVLSDVTLDSLLTTKETHFSKVPFKSGVNGLMNQVQEFDNTHYEQFSKLLNLNQFKMIFPEVAQDAKAYYHSITLFSNGLFTDVKNGGLQKDLSIGLRGGSFDLNGNIDPLDSANSPETFGNTGDHILWLDNEEPTIGESNPGGPKWSQLRSFYNMHKNIEQGSDPISGDTIPVFKKTILPSEDRMSIAPALSKFHNYFMGTLVYDPANDASASKKAYRLRLHYFPAIVLWNPYSVAIPANDYYLSLSGTLGINYQADNTTPRMVNKHWHYKTWNIRKGLDDGDTSKGWYNFSGANWENFGTFGSGNSAHAYEFLIKSPMIPPGRAMIFSPTTSQEYDLSDYTQNVLEPGFRAEKNFHLDSDDFFTLFTQQVVKKIELNFSTGNSRALYLAKDKISHLTNPYWVHGGFQLNERSGWEYRYDVPQDIASAEDYFYKKPTELLQDTDGDGKSDGFDIQGLTNTPKGGIDIVMRVPNNSIQSVSSYPHKGLKWITQSNPRANYSYGSPWDSKPNNTGVKRGYGGNPLFHGTMTSLNSANYTIHEDFMAPGYSYTGISETASNSASVNILFDIPKGDYNSKKGHYDPYPYTSHADLAHAHLTYPQTMWESFDHWHQDSNSPAYPIGNSFANLRTGKDQIYRKDTGFTTESDWGNRDQDSVHFDWSYTLNESLWDQYYFSTLTDPELSDFEDQNKIQNPNYNFFNQELPINIENLENINRSAAYVFRENAFNINSTSLHAWRALFYTLRDSDVLAIDQNTVYNNQKKTPFSRINNPASGSMTSTTTETKDLAYNGFRTLSDDEIDALSSNMVEEVIKRGPFLSLSQFINRSYQQQDDSSLKLAGALQTAINEAGLNDQFGLETTANQYLNESTPSGNNDPEVDMSVYETDILAGHLVEGIPAYLMQSDVLQRIGSLLQARSDTFKIRSYGSKVNIRGKVTAKAWCEAVVQRTADFVDTEKDETGYLKNAPWLELNEKTGSKQRKYKVLDFKWLNYDKL